MGIQQIINVNIKKVATTLFTLNKSRQRYIKRDEKSGFSKIKQLFAAV